MATYAKVPKVDDLLKQVQAPRVQPPAVATGAPGPTPAAKPATSPAAERYLASFGPNYQKNVKENLGGNTLQDWFNNAVAAGAVSPEGERIRPAAKEPARHGGGGGAAAAAAPIGGTAPAGSVESQVAQHVRDMLAGKGGAYGDEEVTRMKSAAKSAAEGQRGAAEQQAQDWMVQNRVPLGSGVGARMAADASRAAGSAYTSAVADILNRQAESQEEARQAGASAGLNLSGIQFQREQAERDRAEREAARRARNRGPSTFTYIDPETGDQYSLPMDLL